ncbi:DUF488 family protein [Salinisphaera sp. T31B1]|uniref:DUF488 domain-containing protein n=1 Tax=Salinisphaera sp. T31B1 TaxID=727963 RepID=UPI00333E6B50
MTIKIKRIYDPLIADDGYRVLVDRIWPRGIAKQDAALDEWARVLAPSTRLRRWFGHDRQRWTGFRRAYLEELADCDPAPADALRARARDGQVTLLFAARDTEYNHAVVLARYLEQRS